METLVSVIVPVYKVEKYLNRCVESIVSQKYSNLEIILVDDGSPDGCPRMCDEWAKKDGRIIVIHKENGGLSDARNAGIKKAKGEYLCFVDSDDYIMPTMISDLLIAVKENGVKLAIANFSCINEDGKRRFEKNQSPIIDGVYEAKELLPLFYQGLGWFYIVAWNKLYHRSLFENLLFPVGKIHEDEYVAAQIIWNAGTIACIKNEEYCYIYQRSGSITSEKQGIKFENWLEALYLRFEFYKEKQEEELMRETRAVYFRELEKLFCDEKLLKEMSKETIYRLKNYYKQMSGKTRNEKIYWGLFQISPRIERKIVKFLRSCKK